MTTCVTLQTLSISYWVLTDRHSSGGSASAVTVVGSCLLASHPTSDFGVLPCSALLKCLLLYLLIFLRHFNNQLWALHSWPFCFTAVFLVCDPPSDSMDMCPVSAASSCFSLLTCILGVRDCSFCASSHSWRMLLVGTWLWLQLIPQSLLNFLCHCTYIHKHA